MEILQSFVQQIHAARKSRKILSIRGGGSKDFYGNAPGDFEILDTRAYSGIVSYEPSELVVNVKAGTALTQLEAVLAEQNQYLAFDPPHYVRAACFAREGTRLHDYRAEAGSVATVGGMVAAGLSGTSRAAVGCVRDFVLGMQVLNAEGEVLRFGGEVMKNVAGYDVSRLMTGSMGTLGLIAQVSLKVLPVPRAQATLAIGCTQVQALGMYNVWRRLPLPINATVWVPAIASEATAGVLWVRLRGAAAAVDATTGKLVREYGAELVHGNAPHAVAAANAYWRAVADHALPFFSPPAPHLCLWRLSVPAATPELALPCAPQLVEWQGAQRWVWAAASAQALLQTRAQAAGGHAVLFRPSIANAAADKQNRTFTAHPPVLARINQNLRSALDPHGVFNTQRL